MDFLTFVRSLDEFIYEVVTWMLFYPRTLWRAVRHPSSLAVETAGDLSETFDQQFTDLVSPPLFLMLSILIAHALELSLHVRMVHLQSDFGERVMQSDTNLLIFRCVAFSLFPLVMAAGLLRRQSVAIDRKTLRAPFFQQCFYASPFALAVSAALTFARLQPIGVQVAGGVLALAAIAWYLSVEAAWFQTQLGISRLNSYLIVLKLFSLSIVAIIAFGLLILGPAAL